MKKNIFNFFISFIIVICSLYLLLELITLNVLPPKYLYLVVTLLFTIDFVLILLCFQSIRKKIFRFVLLAGVVVYSCGTAFGGYYLQKTNELFKNITDTSGRSKNVVSVIVNQSSDMKDLRDIASKKVGTLNLLGLSGTQACLKDIQSKKLTFQQEKYENLSDLINALYHMEMDAIIVNESNREIINDMEAYPLFDENTRVIYQTTFETSEIDQAKAVKDIIAHPFTILISGSDSRLDLKENARSDVNMLVTVNPLTHTVLLTSIPRDYYVTTVCDENDACMNNRMDKITHTGVTGVNATKKTVEHLFDMEINYTFKVGFDSVTNIVDAIGGIDVEVDPDYAVPSIGIKEGKNHLNGEKALRFARERFSYTEGDRQRTKNQQLVFKAVLDKLTTPEFVTQYPSLLKALETMFVTNMSSNEIQSLIQYQIQNRSSWKVEQYMVDGKGDSLMCAQLGQPAYVMVPDEYTVELAKKKIEAVKNGLSSDEIY